MNRPNILWITTDSQRHDTLGCLGNRFVTTPNLDGLAANGRLFNHCYCQNPLCMPSRASFMTGRYPRTNRARQNGQTLPDDEVLASRRLADAGYLCGMVGRLHASAGRFSERRRNNDGYAYWHYSAVPFRDWRGDFDHAATNEYAYWLREKGVTDHEQYVWDPDKDSPRAVRGSRYVQAGIEPELHDTTWSADMAVQFIEANTTLGSPWMLNLNLNAPHHPFDPPLDCLEPYLDRLEDIPLPNYTPGELDNKGSFQQRTHEGAYNQPGIFRYDEMSEEDHRLIRAAYWADIDLVDAQLGRVLDTLERTGQRDNTMVIFHSDHGEMLGDHGMYLKGPFFYDPMVRVPLIIAWPGTIPAMKKTGQAMVELVDIAPTVLEAAGLPVDSGMQGRSLYPLLSGENMPDRHRDDIYCEHYKSSAMYRDPSPYLTMVRTEACKLVVLHSADAGELYDLESDPGESMNRWDDPGYRDIKLAMMKRVCDRMAWTVDPLPEREKNF